MANRGDIDLSWEGELHGYMFADERPLQETPVHSPTRFWSAEQKTWIAGRGRSSFSREPEGYFDAQDMWTMTDGALFPSMQWHWAKGIVTGDFHAPGSVSWKKCLGSTRYISSAFTASQIYNADAAYILLRRVGNPGTLTLVLASDSSGSPGTTLKSATITASDVTDTVSRWAIFDWTGTQSLSGGTVYHVYVYGAESDTEAHHWEVAVDESGSASKVSSNGSSWSAPGFTMYYRVIAPKISRVFYPFMLEGALYVVDNKASGGNSQVWVNGDRGTATGVGTNTLTDSNKSWVTDRWAGAWVRIISGVGDGQYRQITSNTGTTLTVSPDWDVQPTSGKYIIYATDWWTECTSTGLGRVVGQPAVANNIAYFPQGSAAAIRQMYVSGSGYGYGNDGAQTANMIYAYQGDTGPVMIKETDNNTIEYCVPVTSVGNNTWAELCKVGSGDYNVRGAISADGALYILKEDAPYKVVGGRVVRLSTGFDAIPSKDTGAASIFHNQALYMSFGNTIVKIYGGIATDIHNYRSGYDGLPEDRRGACSSLESALGWLFAAIDAGSSGWSSVMAYNEIGWCEIMRGYAPGARISRVFWQPCPNAQPRLWIAIDDTLVSIKFPNNTSNPLRDGACEFQHEAVLVTSTIDMNEPSLYKMATRLEVITERLENGVIEVDYQTDEDIGTTTWYPVGILAASPTDGIDAYLGGIHRVRFRLRLHSASNTSPPVIHSIMPSGQMKANEKWQWVCVLKFGPNVIDKMGKRQDPREELKWLKERAARADKLILHSADAALDGRIVTIESPSRVVESVDSSGKWTGLVYLTLHDA